MIRACGLATLVTRSEGELVATQLPMVLAAEEGEHGVLYGHVARANDQWKQAVEGDAMVLFPGIDAYIRPGWLASKAETARVVPTWNYLAVHAWGAVEFFDEPERLLRVVTQLTELHEAGREEPWSVTDAPPEYLEGMLRAIVGVRLPIRRVEAKKKLNQRQGAKDRASVREGLASSGSESGRSLSKLIPE